MKDKKKQNYDFGSSSKNWRDNQKKLIGTEAFNAQEALRKQDER